MRSKTDRHWQKWGELNPYYGVLGVESDTIDSETQRQAFNESGAQHIDRVLSVIDHRFGGLESRTAALDFGCGVGRLLLPLSSQFDAATGVDISPAMLSHAAENLKDRDNVTLVEGLPKVGANARFDLVHTFIVMQHIRPQFGFPIISDLVDKVRPGGFFALHITVGDLRRARRRMNWFRYRFPPLHWAYNLARKRPFNEPMTEMNKYDLATLLQLLKGRHQGALVIEPIYQVDYMGAMVIGKRS